MMTQDDLIAAIVRAAPQIGQLLADAVRAALAAGGDRTPSSHPETAPESARPPASRQTATLTVSIFGESKEDRVRRLAAERQKRRRVSRAERDTSATRVTKQRDARDASVTRERDASVTNSVTRVTKQRDARDKSVTERDKSHACPPPSDSPPASSSLNASNDDDAFTNTERDSVTARVTRERDACVTDSVTRVTGERDTVTARHAPGDPNDPEVIIAGWVGHDLNLSDASRIDRAMNALAVQPQVAIAGNLHERIDLFVLALRQMIADGKPYGTLTGVLAYCNSVVERCARDCCLPSVWGGDEVRDRKKAKTHERERSTDWSKVLS